MPPASRPATSLAVPIRRRAAVRPREHAIRANEPNPLLVSPRRVPPWSTIVTPEATIVHAGATKSHVDPTVAAQVAARRRRPGVGAPRYDCAGRFARAGARRPVRAGPWWDEAGMPSRQLGPIKRSPIGRGIGKDLLADLRRGDS